MGLDRTNVEQGPAYPFLLFPYNITRIPVISSGGTPLGGGDTEYCQLNNGFCLSQYLLDDFSFYICQAEWPSLEFEGELLVIKT